MHAQLNKQAQLIFLLPFSSVLFCFFFFTFHLNFPQEDHRLLSIKTQPIKPSPITAIYKAEHCLHPTMGAHTVSPHACVKAISHSPPPSVYLQLKPSRHSAANSAKAQTPCHYLLYAPREAKNWQSGWLVRLSRSQSEAACCKKLASCRSPSVEDHIELLNL